jgi:hypothetical protein
VFCAPRPIFAKASSFAWSLVDDPLSDLRMQSALHQWFDNLVSFLPIIPKDVLVAVAVATYALPLVLAFISRRIVIVLGSAVAVVLSFLAILEPHSIPLIFAASAYLGSILVAIYGILIGQTHSAILAKCADLELKVADLQTAEDRRFLAELNKKDHSEDLLIPWTPTKPQRKRPRKKLLKEMSPVTSESQELYPTQSPELSPIE